MSTSPTPGDTPGRAPGRDFVLWCAAALALGLRLALWLHRSGPLWFEEDVPRAWAFRLWGFEHGHFDPNPHSAIWPHLSVYFYFLVQLLQYVAGRLTGRYAGPADFRAAVALDPDLLRAGAMVAALLVGLATLWAAARLARRVAGRGAAPWVVLALALDPLFVRYALVISPDMLLTLFTLLGLLAALDVRARGAWRDSLRGGLWLGLGAACKYSPGLLAVPLVVAHAARPGGRRGLGVLRDGRLWLAALVSLVAFAATTPFTLVDLTRRWTDLQLGASVLTAGQFGSARAPAILYYLRQGLPADLGWPLLLLLAAGVGWTLLRRTPERVVTLAFLVTYALVFGLVPTAFDRYLLPALPPALALTAAAARDLWARVTARRWVAAAAALALLGLGWQCARFMRDYLQPDARALARAWCLQHLPDRALVVTEYLAPPLPNRGPLEAAANAPGTSIHWRGTLARLPAYWVTQLPLSFPDPEITAPFYDPVACLDFDYTITSSGVSARYRADPARFPAQMDFYRALDRYFEVVYRSPAAGRVGPDITVYRPVAARRAALAAWWAARAPFHPPSTREVSPDRIAAVFAERARMLGGAERYGAAAREWRMALRWAEAPADWWLQYGLCAEFAGQRREARAAQRTAYTRDPALAEAGLSWAENAERLGLREESARVLRQVLRRGGLAPDQRERAERLERTLAGPARR